jgi:hypothetical protein
MRTFSRISGFLVAALAVLPLTGCLRREVTHTIYLSPSGAAWSAMEKDVRSDERDPFKRSSEEHDYVLAGRVERQPIAVALRRLGAAPVTTTWLRRERPYTLVTEGHFTDLRQLAVSMLRDAGMDGEATLVSDRLPHDASRCASTWRRGTSAEGETARRRVARATADAYRSS